MKLQYQLSNGNWIDCKKPEYDRTEEFLLLCEKFSDKKLNRAEIIAELEAGKILRNDSCDWYSNCRCFEAYQRKIDARRAATPPTILVKCSCGHTVPKIQVMSSSTGSSCPDCYDRMS